MITFIFSHLYPLVSLVSIYAYTPQIKLLLKSEGHSPDISLRSWLLWVIASIVTLGYACFCGHDGSFRFISFVTLALTTTIFCILSYKRFARYAADRDTTPRTFP